MAFNRDRKMLKTQGRIVRARAKQQDQLAGRIAVARKMANGGGAFGPQQSARASDRAGIRPVGFARG